MSHKNALVAVILLVIIGFSALYLGGIGPYWKITPDSTTYVLGAKSIAEGHGYKEREKPAHLFPPATSIIYAFFIRFFPDNYLVLRAVTVVAALLALLCFFLLFKKEKGILTSSVLILLSAGSIMLFTQTTFLLSDIFYLLFSGLSLLLIYDIFKGDAGKLEYAAMGAAVFVACMTREIGLALVAAVMVASAACIFKKERKVSVVLTSLLMLIALVAVLAWELRSYKVGGYSYISLFLQKEEYVPGSGMASLADIVNSFIANFGRYGRMGDLIMNKHYQQTAAFHSYFHMAMLAIFFIGLLNSFRKKSNVTGIYTVLYLISVGLNKGDAGLRYFVPIVPLLFYYVLEGLGFIRDLAKPLIRPFLAMLCYAMLVAAVLMYAWHGMTYMIKAIPKERASPFGDFKIKYERNYDYQSLAIWLRDNTDDKARYVCFHPNVVDVITHRKGYAFPLSRNPSKLIDLINKVSAEYVLVDKDDAGDNEFLVPVIKAFPSNFKIIKDEKKAMLYEFKAN
jgi:hypothetical protein